MRKKIKCGRCEPAVKTKIIITTTIMMLVLVLTQTTVYSTAAELDRDQIRVTIRINDMIEVEIDSNPLDFNLADGISSAINFNVTVNTPLTVSFESKPGFGKQLNDLFEYGNLY